MADKSIIVIGAGLAGLSTGCYAQMNGYHSHIFEHHSTPGGVATAWKRKDYTIDGGIHFLMGHQPGQPLHEMYCELGIFPAIRVCDLTTYGLFVDEASGRRVVITRDLDRLACDLKALSPADAQVIGDLITGARAMQHAEMADMGMAKPPELMGPLDQLKQMWDMRRVFRYFTGKYTRPVTDYLQALHDLWLRWVLENMFLPEVPAWFICMLLALLANGQMGLLEGGSLGFALAIEKRYRDLGGQVTYTATVEEILVENDRAVGVCLADGSQHRADVVVSAADGYSTIFKMLGGRYVDASIAHRYRHWKLIRPIVMVSFGVARDFAGESWLRMIKLKCPFTVGHQAVEAIMVRIFNYSTCFAPPGKTVVQVVFETEWDFWNEWQRDPPHYDAEKDRVAAEVLARLEMHYPGISSQVEVTDVATPYTFWRYTLNYRGAYEGWLPTPEAINSLLPRTLPGLANFYMAGQWVMPGGGVPACLYSGRHVVQILCHREGKPFSTNIQESS
jgi:phytoene desaturase